MRPLLEVLRRHPQVWLLSDDIYEHLLYDGAAFVTAAQLEPGLKERTLTVNGVSKSYAMTGWRLGYGAGPKSLIAAMAVVQSQSTSNPCSISQAAAVAALNGPQELVAQWRDAFQRRRDFVVERLNAIEGISCRRPAWPLRSRKTPGGRGSRSELAGPLTGGRIHVPRRPPATTYR